MISTEELYRIYKECGYKVSTDTRNIAHGVVFFALKGERFNANSFAREALERGAAYAVIDEEAYVQDERTLLVQNGLTALQELATHHRNKLKIPVIGIGGSNGKTTTKELVHNVLSQKYRTLSTSGNFNNHIGVPLTLLSIQPDVEIAVIELGANRIGDIEELCRIARPDYGLITNIGKEHLEGFGSLEGVAKAESELYYHLWKSGGMVFVHAEDDWLMRMSKNIKRKHLYSRLDSSCDTYCILEQDFPEISFTFRSEHITSKLSGSYNFENIMGAVAIGQYFNVSESQIRQGIENYEPRNKRSQIIRHNGILVLLDAYNANPSSMEKAIENFSRFDAPRKIVILGDMFEMGEHAQREHEAIYRMARALKFDALMVAGEHFKSEAVKMGDRGFDNAQQINEILKQMPLEQAAIFVKGSRGMAMEKALEGIVPYA